jgi:hypothetical protein
MTIYWRKDGTRVMVLDNGTEIIIGTVKIKK